MRAAIKEPKHGMHHHDEEDDHDHDHGQSRLDNSCINKIKKTLF